MIAAQGRTGYAEASRAVCWTLSNASAGVIQPRRRCAGLRRRSTAATSCGNVVLASLAVMATTKKVRELDALDLDKLVSYKSTDSTPTTASTVQVAGRLYSIHHGFEDTRLGIGPTVVVVTDTDATVDFV